MIKAVIIDDEKDARFLLRNLLEEHLGKNVQVVGEAETIESGVDAIKKNKPDLVFLDIKLRKGTGFDLLGKLKKINFEVIFITAYDKYALEAFRFSAFGYLLKPIKIKELKEIVQRLESRINTLKKEVDKRLKVLIENYGDDRKIKKLVISNMLGFQVIPIEQIIRLEGDRNYTKFIITENQKVTTTKSIGEYEEMLNDLGFFRIHQSTIVNLRHVVGYEKGDGGKVEMIDGFKLQLSRYRKAEFIERFL